MTREFRDQLTIGGAVALSALATALWTWPADHEVAQPPILIMPPLPQMTVRLTGAALQHPLFATSRDPAPPPSTTENASATPATPAPGIVGIVSSRRSAVALIKSAAGETVTGRVGQVFDGWTLRAIARDHVTFGRGAEAADVGLDFRNKVTAAGSTPPPDAKPLPAIPLPPSGS